MLVLTRTPNEEIRIGDEIVVRVLEVKGDKVRIGIEAPAEVPVHRQEVYAEIMTTNREALRVAGSGLEKAQRLAESRAAAAGGGTTARKGRGVALDVREQRG